MIGGSLQETIGKMASMPAMQLQAMAKDPQLGYLAATELRARNQKRAAMQPPMQPPQGTVVDAEAQKAAQAEMAGIMGGIPMQPPVRRMANGGVVGFADGGSPSEMELRARAREISLRTGVPAEKIYLSLVLQNEKSTTETPRRNVLDNLGQMGAPRTLAANPIDVMTGFAKEFSTDQVPPPVSDVYPDVRGSMRDPSILQNTPQAVSAPTGVPPPNIKPPDAPPQVNPKVSGGASVSAGIMSGTAGGGGTGGWSKLPELVQPKEYLTPDMMKAAMEGQRAALEQREQNAYRAPDLAQQQSDLLAQRNWLDQQNPQDPDVVVAKARLDKQIRQLENNRPNNIRQGWIEAGLGMLASESPFFGVGIGRGGLQGTRAFRELESNDARRMDSLSSQQMQAGLAEQARKAGIFNNAIAVQAQREGQLERERAGRDALLQDKGKLSMMPVSMAEAAAGIDSKAGESAYRANASRLGLGALEVSRRSEDTDAYNASTQRAGLSYRIKADNQNALDAKQETVWRNITSDIDKAFVKQEEDTRALIEGLQSARNTTALKPAVERWKQIQLKKADMALARTAGTPELYKRAQAQKAELERQFGMQQDGGSKLRKDLPGTVPLGDKG